MPLLPWSLVPLEPVWSGATIQFVKIKELKGKLDTEIEDANPNSGLPPPKTGDEKTFRQMLLQESRSDWNPIVYNWTSKFLYDPTAKFEDDILDPNIVNVKKLLDSFKETGIELAAYSLKAWV